MISIKTKLVMVLVALLLLENNISFSDLNEKKPVTIFILINDLEDCFRNITVSHFKPEDTLTYQKHCSFIVQKGGLAQFFV